MQCRRLVFRLAIAVCAAGGAPAVGQPDPPFGSKYQITFPYDPFLQYFAREGSSQPGWIKFTILVDEPGTVYFQDSVNLAYHYDFASRRLAPFLGMTPAEFDAVTLQTTG